MTAPKLWVEMHALVKKSIERGDDRGEILLVIFGIASAVATTLGMDSGEVIRLFHRGLDAAVKTNEKVGNLFDPEARS